MTSNTPSTYEQAPVFLQDLAKATTLEDFEFELSLIEDYLDSSYESNLLWRVSDVRGLFQSFTILELIIIRQPLIGTGKVHNI